MPTLPAFATFLRTSREKAGLTQAVLASKCGLTGSYISLLESGKKPAPSDRVVKRLAAALKADPAGALQIAHVDRAPEDLRRTFDRLRSQAARERRMRERTAEALFPFSIWNLVPGTVPQRVRNAVGADLGTDLLEAIDRLAALARSAPDLLTLKRESRRLLDALPEEKRRRILDAAPLLAEGAATGGSLRTLPAPGEGLPPEVAPGDRVVVDPALEPAEGDVVLVEEASGPALRRFAQGLAGVSGVVVEVRRRLK